jgi:nitroimidazol reductase NimA-like FMN-containing flavoprotein (pyridoxamine 5'-phosphate oxidase superfamily)
VTDLAAAARAIVDEGRYMTLATADADGRPWASPVWYAPDGYRDLYWVSLPDATHSRNIAVRPEVGIVIFDSGVPPNTGQGVYMAAVAGEVPDAELDRGVAVFSERSRAQGMSEWPRERVVAPAPHRLYRARVTEHSVLDDAKRPGDQRSAVEI